ncbi:hypothetical protein [Nocardia sp. CDC153]|uniref:hypothetical protein n=1 Tax=Nocardia sp. CDC153 TaxID=3112167 RepID=UPI003FA3639A
MPESHTHDESIGKCTNNFNSGLGGLAPSARVFRADNGAAISVKSLHRNGERPLVWSLDELMRFVPRPVAEVISNPGEVMRVRLASERFAEVIMLAHMIGDGSFVKRQPIRYASIDEDNLSAVAAAAKHFGITAVRDEYAAARVSTLRLPAPHRLTITFLYDVGCHGARGVIGEACIPTQ